MTRVLMIEDDAEMAEILSDYLKTYNIHVTNYETPELGLSALRVEPYDIVILDLSLPGMDGLEVCHAIRKDHMIPIIISSARSDITDKAACFSMGADDYLPKPYETRELVLRIHSILRRCTATPKTDAEPERPLTLDEERMEIRLEGRLLRLTNAEHQVLGYLIKRSGYVVSREELLMNVESIKYDSTLKSIDVIISRLRQKVERGTKGPRYILSVRGVGYKLLNEYA